MDKFDKAHMQTAKVYARLSPAKRLKVGAILVKEGRIISIGYNGTPSGWSNDCEYPSKRGALTGNVIELKTKPEVLHAETNAIAKVARSTESADGATGDPARSDGLACRLAMVDPARSTVTGCRGNRRQILTSPGT